MEGPFQPGNVDMLAGRPASPRPDNAMTSWHDIVWAKCQRVVRKLQARFAQAVKAGRWRAVRRLQRLLVHHVVSKRVFGTLDHWIWERLWHWCRRRHPKKNGHWIADRYFVHEGTMLRGRCTSRSGCPAN